VYEVIRQVTLQQCRQSFGFPRRQGCAHAVPCNGVGDDVKPSVLEGFDGRQRLLGVAALFEEMTGPGDRRQIAGARTRGARQPPSEREEVRGRPPPPRREPCGGADQLPPYCWLKPTASEETSPGGDHALSR